MEEADMREEAGGIPPRTVSMLEFLQREGRPLPGIVVVPAGGLVFVNEQGEHLITMMASPCGGVQMTFYGVWGEGRPCVRISTLFGQEGISVLESEGDGAGEAHISITEGGDGLLRTRNADGREPFVVPLSAREG